MEQPQKIQNIRNVALAFFIVTGLLHFGSTILIANNIALKEASILNKTMDIPFVLTGLIYALSCLRLNIASDNRDHKALDISLISVIIIVLIALIVINLAFPDLKA